MGSSGVLGGGATRPKGGSHQHLWEDVQPHWELAIEVFQMVDHALVEVLLISAVLEKERFQ